MPNLSDLDPNDISLSPTAIDKSSIAHGNINQFHPDDVQTTEQKYGTLGQQALTALEGTAQGLAGPAATGAESVLSDLGVPGLSPEEQETRSEVNPLTRYGTEATAFGISSLYGVGEAALLAKIGKGASELGNLGKLGKLAASGGAEFGTLQAGNEITKAINQEDPGQTLGSAAINVGLATALGSLGNVALGSVGPMWKAFTNSAAKDAGVGTALIAEGEDLLTRSILKPKEKSNFLAGLQKQKSNIAEMNEAEQLIGVPFSTSQRSASDYVQSMDSALSQSPTMAGVARRQEIDSGFDKIGGIVDNVMGNVEESTPFQRGQTIKSQIQDTVDNIYQPLKEQYAQRGTLGETIALPDAARLKQYDNLVELSQKFAKANPSVEKMVRDSAEGILRQDTIADLDEYMKVLSSQQRNLRSGATPDHYAANALGQAIDSMEDFQIGEIAKQAKQLAKAGAEHPEAIANDIISQHKALKSRYAEFKNILGDLASDSKLGKRATTAGGIEGVLDSIPNEKIVDKMFDPKNSAGLARLKDKFPDVFKTVIDGKKADLIAGAKGDNKALLDSIFGVNRSGAPKLSPEIRDMMFSPEEQKLMKASKLWMDELPKNVGPSGTPKGSAYMAALTQHPLATIVNNAKDFGIKTLLKFATPQELEANKGMAEYINHAIKGQKTLDNAAKAFFKSGEIIPQHLMPNEKSRERLKSHIDSMNENPEVALKAGGNIGHYLPNHATAAGMLAAQAQSYFNSIKPSQSQGLPLDAKSSKNKQANATYNRALDIAEQPLLVLQHAKNGTLQIQDIKTLNAIYPALHKEIVSKINESMLDHLSSKKPIPYHERQGLSMILGSPLDSTMTWQSVQSIMHSNSIQQTSQQQASGQGKQHKASGKELTQINKVNQMYMTPGERRQTKNG